MPVAKVVLKRGRANPVWRGHPWVFSGAIQNLPAGLVPGDVVAVHDADERLIGHGFANPRSQIAVRMLTVGELASAAQPDVAEHLLPPKALVDSLIHRRIHEASLLRRSIGLPRSDTTAYRLVNSEGDGLPGLNIDVFGDVAAVQFSALGMKLHEDAVYAALRTLPSPPKCIVETAAGSFANIEGFASQNRVVFGDESLLTDGTLCLEHGVRLRIDVREGQKTGAFLDQRDNRLLFGRHCAGAKVLDLYSYAGGFALQALRNGAVEATCVDISPRALKLCSDNSQLNSLGPLHTVESDAFRFLEGARPLHYDVVVVDPPKFARAQKDLPAALKGYQRLNALAMGVVRRGGLLATCSCSQLVDEQSFLRMLAAAASDAGRRVTVLYRGSQGLDHPVPPSFDEGRYLKFVLLGVL
ncbi:MAG: class I SAM-dependent rRNA methyltransferase [Myxococcales bacterium]|nr:class I SAM-dependent rRNA methyltransferase [Myxococcales bacterium]